MPGWRTADYSVLEATSDVQKERRCCVVAVADQGREGKWGKCNNVDLPISPAQNNPRANESAIHGGLGRSRERHGTVQTASQTTLVRQAFYNRRRRQECPRREHIQPLPSILPSVHSPPSRSSTSVLISVWLCSRPPDQQRRRVYNPTNSPEPASRRLNANSFRAAWGILVQIQKSSRQ